MSKPDIVLSIKPKYAEAIFRGDKRVEFRRTRPKREINGMFIHVCGKNKHFAQGYAKVKRIVQGSPQMVWALCSKWSYLFKHEFDAYFDGCETAYAFELEYAYRCHPPVSLKRLGLNGVPQGIAYVKDLAGGSDD